MDHKIHQEVSWQALARTCRRLEDTNFASFNAVIQGAHKLQLDVVGRIRMVEFLSWFDSSHGWGPSSSVPSMFARGRCVVLKAREQTRKEQFPPPTEIQPDLVRDCVLLLQPRLKYFYNALFHLPMCIYDHHLADILFISIIRCPAMIRNPRGKRGPVWSIIGD